MALTDGLPDALRVAVLCGGPGAERAVSLESGRAVTAGLREAGLDAVRVEIEGRAEEMESIPGEVAFLALHGAFGEDGTAQALLEARGIPYTGSGPDACRLTMDKVATKRRLAEAGVAVAPSVEVATADEAGEAVDAGRIALPLVAKPVRSGSSVGVTIVRARSALADAVAMALAEGAGCMLEAFVRGREITAGMLDGAILPLIELGTDREFYDYAAKYDDAGTRYLCPAPVEPGCAERLRRMARTACAATGMEHFCRVDFMAGPDGPVVLEVNAIPGFTSHSLLPMAARAAGRDFPALCREIVRLAWRRHEALAREPKA